jgi:hypothetical protein
MLTVRGQVRIFIFIGEVIGASVTILRRAVVMAWRRRLSAWSAFDMGGVAGNFQADCQGRPVYNREIYNKFKKNS